MTRFRPVAARHARTLALIGALLVGATAPLVGCEKPRDKAQNIVTAGSLIGVTITEGEKIVGKPVTKHDEYNYYWDMGEGNGIIQVLVRGGKITRVDFEEQFIPRAARDNTMPDEKPAPEGAGAPDGAPAAPPVERGG